MTELNFTATLDNMSAIRDIIGTVSTPDSVVVIDYGAQKVGDPENGEQLLAVVKVLGKTSTLMGRVLTGVPEGFEGQPVEVAVKAPLFLNALDALAVYKADISSYVGESSFSLGVEGTGARIAVPTLAEVPLEVKAGVPVVQFTLAPSDNMKMLRKGLSFTAAKGGVDGLQNGVLSIDTTTGKFRSFSMDGVNLAWAFHDGKLPEVPEGNERAKALLDSMNAAMKAYSEKTGGKQTAEHLMVCIPHDEIGCLSRLTAGAKQIVYAVDETHISVMVDNSIAYTLTQGATAVADPDKYIPLMEKMAANAVSVEVDTQKFLQDVDFHLKADGASKTVVDYDVTKDGIKSGAETSVSTVKFDAATGEASFRVNGAHLKEALSEVNKGKLVIQISDAVVLLKNGTLDAIDESCVIGLAQVRKTEPAEASDDEAGDEPAAPEDEDDLADDDES